MSDYASADSEPGGGGEASAGFSIRWRTAALGLAISALFTGLFLVGLHPEELREVPTMVDPWLVLLAASVLFLEFPMRALRWRILLTPIHLRAHGPGGPEPLGIRQLFSITVIGFMANNLLPARAGELVRPYLASRDGRLGFESVLVTSVLERGFDILGLGTVAALTLLLLPGSGADAMDSTLLSQLTQVASALGALAIGGMILMCAVALRGERFRPLVEWIAQRLPGPVGRFGLRLFDGVLQGLASLEVGWRPLVAALITAAIWINGAAAIWLLMESFHLDLPFAAACFLSLTIALAVVLPQAPGFVGVFQVATQATLMAWGVAVGPSQGFAILFWLVSFVPVTVAGLFSAWGRGQSLRRLVSRAAQVGPSARAVPLTPVTSGAGGMPGAHT